jgi:hypothetical protein
MAVPTGFSLAKCTISLDFSTSYCFCLLLWADCCLRQLYNQIVIQICDHASSMSLIK